jgi:hypothetical protein
MSLSTELTALTSTTVILSGKGNYQKWSWNIGGTARLGGFWPALDGTNTPAEDTAVHIEAVAQREMKALGLLMKTVDPVIALEIQSMPKVEVTKTENNKSVTTSRSPNAKEIWDFLETRYHKSDAITSLYNYRLLHQTALIDDGTLEAQINALIQIRSRCALNGLKLEDFQFAATILIALPESYSQIVDSLLTHGKLEDLSVETVQAKILETEIRRKNEANPAANAMRRSAKLSSSKDKPKGQCFNCGKKGHYANVCQSKSKSDAPAASSPSPKDLG